MERVTFGPMEVIETETGRAECDIRQGGEVVGNIEKGVEDVGGTSFEWRASGYDVTFWSVEGADRWFPVRDYPTGARGALAAARAYAREVLKDD